MECFKEKQCTSTRSELFVERKKKKMNGENRKEIEM